MLDFISCILTNSLMGCAVHVLAVPTPTTFSAATDTLSYNMGRFMSGSNECQHILELH